MHALMTLRVALLLACKKLTHPGVGVTSALLTALLCGLGIILSKYLPDFHHLHFGAYWLAPHSHPIWVFALVTTVGVWCAHAVLGLLGLVATGTGRGTLWRPIAVPQAVVALAIGFYVWLEIRPPEERFVISDIPVDVHGETYRALRVEASSRNRGHRRPVVAWVERKAGSSTERLRVRREQPWASASGTYRLTLDHADMVTRGVILRHGQEHVELATNRPVLSGTDTLVLHGVQNPGPESAKATPKADVSIGSQRTLLPLDPEWTGETALLSLKESPVLVLRVHKNVEALLAALGIASFLAGIVLFIFSTFRVSRLH